jgi:hypothetical protein
MKGRPEGLDAEECEALGEELVQVVEKNLGAE